MVWTVADTLGLNFLKERRNRSTAVALNGGDFDPRGHLVISGDTFGCHSGRGVLMKSRGLRPGMLQKAPRLKPGSRPGGPWTWDSGLSPHT